ncbi:hypothetical protein HDU67_009795 [Dinochytrium kinnereticum]|nr:hypothetical protein HDU67_009795 [Dinochytrium kinnereticum]
MDESATPEMAQAPVAAQSPVPSEHDAVDQVPVESVLKGAVEFEGSLGMSELWGPLSAQVVGEEDDHEGEEFTPTVKVGGGSGVDRGVVAASITEWPAPPQTWTVDQVQTWLDSMGFRQEVCDVFKDHAIDGPALLSLTDHQLETQFKFMSSNLRSMILNVRGRTLLEGPFAALTDFGGRHARQRGGGGRQHVDAFGAPVLPPPY